MNLFELFVKIGVDDQASENVDRLSKSLKRGLATAAKMGVAAVTAAAVGITALTAAAVKEYAEYEQLVGGVKTLFKESSDTVRKYAEEAYKTAGISSNEYMSQVTSFSASLLQSLAYDTEKAAAYGDMAVRDMADNANKFGTAIESIQAAYQGFSKQNFTMLDNLKLGYGGTKTEMERLIEKANRLKEANGEMADLTISDFSDIVEAIHIIQGEMEITGAAAVEVEKTISGSTASMAAAWENLLVGIADDNADFEKLIDNFLATLFGDENGNGGVINNIIPRIKTAFGGISRFISSFVDEISEELPDLLETFIPEFAEGISKITQSVSDMLSGEGGEQIIDAIVGGLKTILVSLLDESPAIVGGVVDLIISLVDAIGDNIDEILPSLISAIIGIVDELTNPERITKLTAALINLVGGIIKGLTDPAILLKIVESALNLIVGIIKELASPQNAPIILKALIDAILGILHLGILTQQVDPRETWGSYAGGGSHRGGISVEADNYPPEPPATEIPESAYESTETGDEKNSNSVTINQNIYAQEQTAADLMEEAYYKAMQEVMNGGN